MMKFEVIPHFAIRIACAFILFTAIGTLTHEFGHLAVAEYFGYETKLNYGSLQYDDPGYNQDPLVLELQTILKEHQDDIVQEKSFIAQPRYLELRKLISQKYPRSKSHAFWITLGGPVQTILTSFLGLFILFYRKSKQKEFFTLFDWLGVFFALFVLREVFNYIITLYATLVRGSFMSYNDEYKLSRWLDWNQWTVPTFTFLLGLLISMYVIFKVIPLKYRFTFIIAGFFGGILGFFIWLRWLGPVLMP
jgi:hypothetical protein